MFRNSVLIIPSLNPDKRLISYVRELTANGFTKIILVDDGSSQKNKPVFDAICSSMKCDLFVHTVNMGKGRSLKDALNYYCQKYAGDYAGVITADADGQHTLEDVIRLDDAIAKYPKSLILGVRDFDHPSVPFKSKFGNKLTRQILRLMIGNAQQETPHGHAKAISDTQTGLRAIPNALIPDYLTLTGERFEYETNMLIEALHTHTPIKEIPIQTIYLDDNKETHFRPFADSAAIYGQIFSTFFKYAIASLSSFFLDYGIYSLFILLLGFLPLGVKIWISAAFARILSSIYNYTVNKNVVFKQYVHKKNTLEKYYVLCAVQLCCSAQLVWLICEHTSFSEIPVKLFADTVLFVLGFYIQKNWVFREQNLNGSFFSMNQTERKKG